MLRAMLLKIVQAGTPVLRQKARSLTPAEIRGAPVQLLIELMRETMRDAPGVGLAAPQIGEPLRLAVIEDQVTRDEARAHAGPLSRHRQPRAALPRRAAPRWSITSKAASASTATRRSSAAAREVVGDRARSPRRTDHHRRRRLVRAHPAARDRSPERRPVHRPHAHAHLLDRDATSVPTGSGRRPGAIVAALDAEDRS